ncbi:hypothetical protein [Nocardioides luteus]|uniref:Uncharacterized protein n=1 Tax=Nocardioides luteus TaxID=1844 RepID=A0A1J4N829_9ACTN|nr:hypothetical protein [Nocardioides luteus]OIJ27668.1 hypothetical protein UG56_006605 [Nocardioides luteus]
MAKKKSRFVRYFGYLLLALAVLLLFGFDVGPLTLSGVFVVCFVWLLFAAPTSCGAEIRTGENCRNNSYGLLGGCSIRQHKWQRVRALTHLDTARNACRGWFTGPQQQVATCSMLIAAFGAVAALFK